MLSIRSLQKLAIAYADSPQLKRNLTSRFVLDATR